MINNYDEYVLQMNIDIMKLSCSTLTRSTLKTINEQPQSRKSWLYELWSVRFYGKIVNRIISKMRNLIKQLQKTAKFLPHNIIFKTTHYNS